MKVLLVTQYFYPENFKSNDIAFELAKRGHKVDVLTGIPNYPGGKYYKGYGVFKRRLERVKGVRIYRALLLPRAGGEGFSLALNYFSFAFSASIWAAFLSLRGKYDAIIVHENSPVTQGIPAVIAKKIRKTPLYFWVLDLWPESLISAGGVRNKRIISFFESITRFIYNNSDKILISSNGFAESILAKGDYKEKLIYFPNWGEDVFLSSPKSQIPDLPEGFKIMFAGNIGEAQDFDSILEAAKELRDYSDIKWVFVGDGRRLSWVKDYIASNHLAETVFTLGKLPLEAMPALFKRADVMLVSLKDEPIFNLTIPAKLQAYMAAARPVIGMLNGEGAEIIKQANCGAVVMAGNARGLADEVLRLSKLNKEALDHMGQEGFTYYVSNFDKDHCITNLCNILSQA